MIVGLLLWWVLVSGCSRSQQASPSQAPSSQSTSNSSNPQSEDRPAERATTQKSGEQETNQASPETPSQTEMKPDAKSPDATAGQQQTLGGSNPEVRPSKPSAASPPEEKQESPPATKTSGTQTKKRRSKKHKTTIAQGTTPRRVIVRNGGTEAAVSQLAPDMTTEEASHARETTSQLLSSTETNLQRASTRTLNPDQQALVEQIRSFMGQSNSAVKAGDLQRGHNLALKALLLSNELVRQF